jgi:hypothetical protein
LFLSLIMVKILLISSLATYWPSASILFGTAYLSPARRNRMMARLAVRFYILGFISIMVLSFTAGPVTTRAVGHGYSLENSKLNGAVPLALAAGDFDEDGVADLIAGYSARERNFLTLRRGFTDSTSQSPAILLDTPSLPKMIGTVDFNWDGHTDLAIATKLSNILYLLPGDGRGDFGRAEEFLLPARATALASGQLDGDQMTDLAVASGGDLIILGTEQSIVERHFFSFPIISMAIGDFTGKGKLGLALLSENGTVYLLQRSKRAKEGSGEPSWHISKEFFISKSARLLLAAHSSAGPADSLLAIDPIYGQLYTLSADGTVEAMPLDMGAEVAAALPMQLNGDSLSDLVILLKGRSAPVLLMTEERESNKDFDTNNRGDCSAIPMKIGETLGGFLKMSDCRSRSRGSEFIADRYSFTGTAGQKLEITLGSKDFDSFLYLVDPAGRIVAQDDDSGKGSGAKISFTLKSTGTYTIEATSFRANRSGHYHIHLCFNGITQPVLIG